MQPPDVSAAYLFICFRLLLHGRGAPVPAAEAMGAGAPGFTRALAPTGLWGTSAHVTATGMASPGPDGLAVGTEPRAVPPPQNARYSSLLIAASCARILHKRCGGSRQKSRRWERKAASTNYTHPNATLSLGKVNIIILFVSDQVPKGKSNSFSCLGNCSSHFGGRPRALARPARPVPREPDRAQSTQEPVSYYGA